jgi:hypothetical protein
MKFPRLPNLKLELKRLCHSGFVDNRNVAQPVRCGQPLRVVNGHKCRSRAGTPIDGVAGHHNEQARTR